MTAPVLYHVVCAAPPTLDAAVHIAQAQERGWDVCLVTTPTAARWLDVAPFERLTGHPVRSDYKLPTEPDVLPQPTAVLVAPATSNTMNKWAAGISDTLALGLITEALGMDVTVAAVPFLSAAQARHPAFTRSVRTLRDAGVTVVFGDDVFPLDEPHADGDQRGRFPFRLGLDALEAARR